MKAVILAAGESTRCYPLTLTRPKALMMVANKTILEHNLEQLKNLVEQVMVVVGYKKEMIKECFGEDFKGLKIKYVEQEQQKGTAHALLKCKDESDDRLIVLYGDDLYFEDDIKKLIRHKAGLLVHQSKEPQRFGVVEIERNCVIKIHEKPKRPPSNLVNAGCYILPNNIFETINQLKLSARHELELTDAINKLAQNHRIAAVRAEAWLPNGYPWDLLRSNQHMLGNIQTQIKGKVENNVVIKGNLVLGEGSIIKSGVYLEGNIIVGKNTVIGPNSYIRGYTSIGDNCKVGQSVEIKNSIIMRNSKVPHLSYVGDSVIGENVNLGAGTIIANLRHDNKNIKSMVAGNLVDTGRRKFGTIIGDGVHTGINTNIFPGRKIWPQRTTLPAETVRKDIS